jgi:CheY-like chemotaxis protein
VERVQSVLIVEEDAPMRDMMVAMLRGEGIEVTSADNVDAAVEVLRRDGFDAVLSDVGMHGKGGFELLKLVRALELSIPVILMTSFGDPAVDDRARRAGASGCLSKPFGLEELQAALERAATGPSARASG